MKNKQTDLNDHLFMQLERLSDESLSAEQLANEIDRSKSITAVAQQIIANGKLALDAQVMMSEGSINRMPAIMPRFLGVEDATQIHN
jgi:hypothetical protein